MATIKGTGTTTPSYIHRDHLSSTNVTTNQSGAITTVLDYYPYGTTRIESGTPPSRQYIGQYDDSESDLAYLNARYYDSGRGQFVSQDPVFWSTSQNLIDPQTLNSYSYASNNPINKKDPTGLATVKGSLKETQKALIKVLKSYISLLESAKSNPGGTAKSLAISAGSTAKNVVFNPGGIAYDGAVSARNSFNTFRNGSDAVQDQMIGNGVAAVAGLFLPKGMKRIPDDALVVRGGGLSNQSAQRIDAAIADSVAKGGTGFSANCSGVCTSIDQIHLLDKRPNPTLSVVPAREIRAMGGDVIPTYGGTHVSIVNIGGNAASTLPWIEIDNPHY